MVKDDSFYDVSSKGLRTHSENLLDDSAYYPT